MASDHDQSNWEDMRSGVPTIYQRSAEQHWNFKRRDDRDCACAKPEEDLGWCRLCGKHLQPEPTSPSVKNPYQMCLIRESTYDALVKNQWPCGDRPNPCAGYSCNGINVYGDEKSIDAVSRAFHDQGNLAILREELKLRNQDIADLQLTNLNLSRKIFQEMNRSNGKGAYEGIHGS